MYFGKAVYNGGFEKEFLGLKNCSEIDIFYGDKVVSLERFGTEKVPDDSDMCLSRILFKIGFLFGGTISWFREVFTFELGDAVT